MMRVAGALALLVAILGATLLGLFPTSVTVFGTDVSCGIPAVTAFQEIQPPSTGDLTGAAMQQCREQSGIRLIAAAAVLVVGGVGGVLMLVFGSATPDR